jgi:hypothetical protein
MAFPGYFSYNGTEIINATRTEAYARRHRPSWFRPVYKEENLAWLLGDREYSGPLQDDAPWIETSDPNSFDFFGVYPLSVEGVENSTVTAEVVESIVDGGHVGRTRRATRSMVFSGLLLGASECAVEYGMRWLRSVVNGGPCFNQTYGSCGGYELCYLGCAPSIGEVDVNYSPGSWEVDRVNQSRNPTAELGTAGWKSTDVTRYPIAASTSAPIEGSKSVVATRAATTTVATNLFRNSGMEGGSITGWNTNNSALYPVTLDSSGAVSGTYSCRTDRQNNTINTTVSSINVVSAYGQNYIPVTVGQPITGSVDVKCEQPNRKIGLYWQWLDAGGGLLSSQDIHYAVTNTGTAGTTWRAWVTGVPPVGTVNARIIAGVYTVSGNALIGEKVWYDNARASQGTGILDATNLAHNPGLELGSTSGWVSNSSSVYPLTLDSANPISGSYSALVTRTSTSPSNVLASLTISGTSTRFNATPGVPITVSLDVRPELADRYIQTNFNFYDAGTVLISQPGWVVAVDPLPTGVTRITRTVTPPAGTVTANFLLQAYSNTGNCQTGERLWLDNLMVSESGVTQFFSGNTKPDGQFVYFWTGAMGSSTIQRWRVGDAQQTDIDYFDGNTAGSTSATYAWDGTALQSTSRRMAVTGSTLAEVALTPDDIVPSFECTPGKPITLSVDVKVTEVSREIAGWFSWSGTVETSVPVVIPAGPPGQVTRFVMTAYPPDDVIRCTATIRVSSTAGVPLIGEQVWFDRLLVEQDETSGAYFDGDTADSNDAQYRWAGTAEASQSERLTLDWVEDPAPTAAECFERIGRKMLEVTTTTGPVVTSKMTMTDGSAAWAVTWTMVAADPTEFGVQRPLIKGFLDPGVEMPYVGGELPAGGLLDLDGYTAADEPCPATVYTPVFDPACGLLGLPPDAPSVAPNCFDFPVNFVRRSFTVPRQYIPEWTEVVPIISLTTQQEEARSIRIRFYTDVLATGSPDSDPCSFCCDVVFSYVPPGSTVVLDCAARRVYLDAPGISRRRADTLVSDSTGAPFEWPEFSCGFGYVVTVDMPLQQKELPVVDLSLVPRVA